ncbi:hypothetical protein N180_13790 [Pedobacter antarcticus 4BY]|uniref:Uncharacterized protein n=2 Tax=Pedobacter antarcticus TaxID=34086 RepID=A0A081PGQ4_9SPHI|nr:hypothetical protein N180_13790 [Pedobacter antarcticus 4BY]SFF14675.1 hypothetical protein SAMN03003324_02621 [Pedobacter antarcticus]
MIKQCVIRVNLGLTPYKIGSTTNDTRPRPEQNLNMLPIYKKSSAGFAFYWATCGALVIYADL